jgi:hypothetical protein
MVNDIISGRTRLQFREQTACSVLREIGVAFDAQDVECDTEFQTNCQGERRSRVEQSYHR